MTKRARPVHPKVRARYASEDIGIRMSLTTNAGERAKLEAEGEAEWERIYGKDSMPRLLEQYERDLAEWKAEQRGDAAVIEDMMALEEAIKPRDVDTPKS